MWWISNVNGLKINSVGTRKWYMFDANMSGRPIIEWNNGHKEYNVGAWNIMMSCRTGTSQLKYDINSMYWEHEYHTITFCREYSEKDAMATFHELNAYPNKEVRSIWIEAR